MLDANDLLKLIKKAAVEAVETSKPSAICFGEVVSASPLKITIEQKMTLSKPQLILTRNVTDYEVKMTVDHLTENTEINDVPHKHSYKGKKIFTVHNSLVVGEEVVLIRVQGGQKYLVLDRLT